MRIFPKTAIVFFSLISIFSAHAAYGQAATERLSYVKDGANMLKICATEGSVNVVAKFSSRDWYTLGERVATGDEKWVKASVCLVHGLLFGLETDSVNDIYDFAMATLVDAWTQVLLEKPEIILDLGTQTSLWRMCRYPSNVEEQTLEWVYDYLEKALASLDTVKESYLQTDKKACELYLRLDFERAVRLLIHMSKHR